VSKGTRKRIGKLLAGARAKLAKAASTKKPKAQAKQLKAAGTQLAALENLVLRQTKVAFDLEKTLAGEINDANMATSSYRTSLI